MNIIKHRDMDAQHDEVAISTPSTGHDRENVNSLDKFPPSPMPGTHRFRGFPGRKGRISRFIYPMLIQWGIILALVLGMYGVLIAYSRKTVMSRRDKRIFNALVTGLAIALALMTISFLNGLVIELRWWILSRRYRSRRKVESILHAHSLRKAVALAMSSRRTSIYMFASLWTLLLLTSQVGLASINLCFSLETNEAYALLVPGNVSIPDLQTIHTNRVVHTSKTIGAQQYTANQFGTIALAFREGLLAELPSPGTLFYSDDPLVFCDQDTAHCRYFFHEINTGSLQDPDKIPIQVVTNRVVVTSAECRSYPVVQGGDGSSRNITIDLRNGAGDKQTILLPVAGGSDQTTFMTDTAADNTSSPCGPGCVSIASFEASTQQAWFYDCTATVGKVSNAVLPSHQLGPDLTRMAASAIALQGYASTLTSTPDTPTNATGADLRSQAMIYPAESWWGTSMNGSTQGMAYLLARFAVGVVAIAGESNERHSVWGNAPTMGIRLKMEHWEIVHVILILTAALLLLMGFGAAYLANRVVVPAAGPMAEAQVLRAMMPSDQMGGRLRKGDTGRRGGADEGRKTVWIYRQQHIGGTVYDLYMEEAEVAVTLRRERMFDWLRWR